MEIRYVDSIDELGLIYPAFRYRDEDTNVAYNVYLKPVDDDQDIEDCSQWYISSVCIDVTFADDPHYENHELIKIENIGNIGPVYYMGSEEPLSIGNLAFDYIPDYMVKDISCKWKQWCSAGCPD